MATTLAAFFIIPNANKITEKATKRGKLILQTEKSMTEKNNGSSSFLSFHSFQWIPTPESIIFTLHFYSSNSFTFALGLKKASG